MGGHVPNEIPCTLSVKTGGRLIEEEEQLRLRRKLDADCKTLARLNAKCEHDSVREILKLEQLNHFLNVRVFLRLRNRSRLAEVRRETHSLADSRGTLVNILLLRICGTTSEVRAERVAVDEKIALDYTDVLALR